MPRTRRNDQAPPKEKDYKKIGSVWEKKDYPGQFSISVDNYHGDIIFRQVVKSDDGQLFKERYYKLKYISMFEPRSVNGNEPPKNLQYNLTIDLLNEKAVELVGESEEWMSMPVSDSGDGQSEG